MTPINTVIIANDKVTINDLTRKFSVHFPDFNVLATTQNMDEGERLIHLHHPTLVILEIELKNGNGFRLLDNLIPYLFQVILINKTDVHAMEAIKYSALDYLLIPIQLQELKKAINKVLINSDEHHLIEQLIKAVNGLASMNEMKMYLPLHSLGKIEYVRFENIIYLHAKGSYTDIVIKDGEKINQSNLLGDFINQLPNHFFVRIHHSFIINILYIKSILNHHGQLTLVMVNGDNIPISKSYKVNFSPLL